MPYNPEFRCAACRYPLIEYTNVPSDLDNENPQVFAKKELGCRLMRRPLIQGSEKDKRNVAKEGKIKRRAAADSSSHTPIRQS